MATSSANLTARFDSILAALETLQTRIATLETSSTKKTAKKSPASVTQPGSRWDQMMIGLNALHSRIQALEKAVGLKPVAEDSLISAVANSSANASGTAGCGGSASASSASSAGSFPNLDPIAQDTPTVIRLKQQARTIGLTSAVFKWVPKDYYDRPLEERRSLVGAPSVHHMCKSIIMVNTHCINEGWAMRNNAQYYCVVFQYTQRMDTEKMMQVMRGLNDKVGKKKFNFRLAPEEVSDKLSGFGHNAVTPLGMKEPIPIVLSHRILELKPAYFWMGGGEVDVKLRVDTQQFIDLFNPLVLDVTVPNPDETGAE